MTDFIEAGKSSEGGWSREQLALIEVSWPPVTGWRAAAALKSFSADTRERFVALKDVHLNRRKAGA